MSNDKEKAREFYRQHDKMYTERKIEEKTKNLFKKNNPQ
jgi:hypothetical protein